jgi:hypothetical protein
MFEGFNVAGLYLHDAASLSLCAAGKLSGCSVDIGHGKVDIATVSEGVTHMQSAVRMSVAGQDLTRVRVCATVCACVCMCVCVCKGSSLLLMLLCCAHVWLRCSDVQHMRMCGGQYPCSTRLDAASLLAARQGRGPCAPCAVS